MLGGLHQPWERKDDALNAALRGGFVVYTPSLVSERRGWTGCDLPIQPVAEGFQLGPDEEPR